MCPSPPGCWLDDCPKGFSAPVFRGAMSLWSRLRGARKAFGDLQWHKTSAERLALWLVPALTAVFCSTVMWGLKRRQNPKAATASQIQGQLRWTLRVHAHLTRGGSRIGGWIHRAMRSAVVLCKPVRRLNSASESCASSMPKASSKRRALLTARTLDALCSRGWFWFIGMVTEWISKRVKLPHFWQGVTPNPSKA